MLESMGMNQIVKGVLKWSSVLVFVVLVFLLSIYITMSSLIKGKELVTPDWVGETVQSAFEAAKRLNVHLNPMEGSRLTEGRPFVITRQSPEPGVRIKRFGYIKVYYTPRPDKVLTPDVSGKYLDDAIKILSERGIKRGGISYMDNDVLPVDHVIGQGVKSGAAINRGEEVSLLISRGERSFSYVMPDFIGMSLTKVESFLKNHGLKIANIEKIDYPGLESGIIVKQYPLSGFRISEKNLITLGVSH